MSKRQVILMTPCSSDTELIILRHPLLDKDQIKIVDAYDSDNIVNLKDVSIVLCSMVGNGVVDQLAKELANRSESIRNYLRKNLKSVGLEQQRIDER